jgi:sterol desaturase/sphingolipid hydroxylase (fatty acid hydroxylase superfamily)
VHSDHHTTPGKTYGHLVAHETYDLSVVETASILGSYLIGFELIGLLYKYTLFDIALLVSWAHLIELLGHSQMSWSVDGHPLRILPELTGLNLQIMDHTMHHAKPLSNFSKRLTLFDRLFQTYSPPLDAYGTTADDSDEGAATKRS